MSDQQAGNVQTVVTVSTKNVGVSLILTFLFGSLGMFYSTIIGAIIMLVIEAIVGFLTVGFGLLVTHPICMIWGAVAANRYNKSYYRAMSDNYVYKS